MKENLQPIPSVSKLLKYHQFKIKLEKILKNGTFYRMTFKKRNWLIKKLERLKRSVAGPEVKKMIAAAGLVLAASCVQAQVSFQVKDDIYPFKKNTIRTPGLSNPCIVDLNGDGKPDLVSGSLDGNIHYFKNVGGKMVKPSGDAPLSSVSMGGATDIAFADLNADAMIDAIITNDEGQVEVYLNQGLGDFKKAEGPDDPLSGLSFGGKTFVAAGDIDNDGVADLVFFEVGTSLRYFKKQSGIYTELTGEDNPFDGIAPQGSYGMGLADLDEDGDLDLFVGNKQGKLNYFENVDGVYVAEETIEYGNVVHGDAARFFGDNMVEGTPSFGDIDGDGLTDCVMGLPDGSFMFFKNTGEGILEEVKYKSPVNDGINLADHNSITFFDLDKDGDKDAFIGISDRILYIENLGNGMFEENTSDNPVKGITVYHDLVDDEPVYSGIELLNITFFDLNEDGNDDAFVNMGGEIVYYMNDGYEFEMMPQQNPFNNLGVDNYYSSITFFDLDGDGKKDALLPTQEGQVLVFKNEGDGAFQKLVGEDDPLKAVHVPGALNVVFHDVDGDGLKDMLVSTAEGNVLTFIKEQGGGFTAPELSGVDPFNGYEDGNAFHLAIADVDGDGTEDAMLGGSKITYFKGKELITNKKKAKVAHSYILYPNPASSFVNISGGKATTQWEVLSLQGLSLKSGIGTTVTTNDLDPAMYLVKIKDGSSIIVQQLLVR